MDTMIINQQEKVDYTEKMEELIKQVADAGAKLFSLFENTELSVLIVDNEYIKELNAVYRDKNEATDVLSFAMNEMTEDEPDIEDAAEINVLGDIVISLEQALLQSEEYGHSLERELGYLAAHGLLHLLAYDHNNEDERETMRDLEEKIMSAVKLTR